MPSNAMTAPSAIAPILQSAGLDSPALSADPDYSPWQADYWSPAAQALLREQAPILAEILIARDLDIPDDLKILIASQNPYQMGDRDLQRQCERFFPATCLQWRLGAAVCDGSPTAFERESKAHRIIASRESTTDLYVYRPNGQKVRRSFVVEE